jgi:C-terminal processing protease CtpA/Prc
MDAPFARNQTGLALVPEDGGLTVHYVSPGSPAEAAGWKKGERVTALDGKPVTKDWWRTTLAWAKAKPGTTVRLTMADGSERTLTLARYY